MLGSASCESAIRLPSGESPPSASWVRLTELTVAVGAIWPSTLPAIGATSAWYFAISVGHVGPRLRCRRCW